MTNGWYPGTRLTLELTRPDGVVETYTDMSPARARGAYFAFGPPFGSVFVRKGATYRLFPGDPDVLVGDYLAVVRQANGAGRRGPHARDRHPALAPLPLPARLPSSAPFLRGFAFFFFGVTPSFATSCRMLFSIRNRPE